MRVKDWSENLLAQRGWVATSWPCFLAGDTTRDMPLPSSQNQEISNFSTHPSFPSWVSSLSNCRLLHGQFHQLAIYCLCPRFKVQLSWAVSGVSEYKQNIPKTTLPNNNTQVYSICPICPKHKWVLHFRGHRGFPLNWKGHLNPCFFSVPWALEGGCRYAPFRTECSNNLMLSPLTSYPSLHWLLPTAKPKFSDQGQEEHLYIGTSTSF